MKITNITKELFNKLKCIIYNDKKKIKTFTQTYTKTLQIKSKDFKDNK